MTYPGLFAGGGLDVMTDFLLQTMTASKTCALGGGRGGNGGDEVLSALDFCSGSGTLAAAVRFVRPHARLTLLDADAVAMLAARENLSVVRDGSSSGVGSFQPATFVLSDGWTGLADDEKFDLVVSNPPVHLGLRPEFTVLSDMIAGFEERLNPGGEAWFVAQRYVPIAGICAELGGLAAAVTCAGVNEKFAAWTVRKPGGDASLPEAKTPKRDKKEKSARRRRAPRRRRRRRRRRAPRRRRGEATRVWLTYIIHSRQRVRSVHHASASSSARAMPLGSPGVYGVNPRGSKESIASASPFGSHHRRCPLFPSSSASSAW